MKTKVKSNEQFMLLSVIGIIVVVFCHMPDELFEFTEIFPFITLFVFISGYFYKEQNEENIGKYIYYKLKKLIIPFLIINLIYGIIINILKYFNFINFGADINLYTLLVQPFTNNSQFIFNYPAYFVPAIFLTTSCYAVIHKTAKKVKCFKEEILLGIFIVLNILSLIYRNNFGELNYSLIFLRVMFFLPFFEFGYLYKNKWQEKDDKIPTVPYLIILFGINYFIYKKFGSLNYNMHEFSDFKTGKLLLPIFTSIVAILFYTRLARVLSKWFGKNKLVNYISNNTFAIMTHHMFVLFTFNFILYLINCYIIQIPYYDAARFAQGWVYIYEIPNWRKLMQIGYVIYAIAGSLGLQCIYDKIKEKYISKKEKNLKDEKQEKEFETIAR